MIWCATGPSRTYTIPRGGPTTSGDAHAGSSSPTRSTTVGASSRSAAGRRLHPLPRARRFPEVIGLDISSVRLAEARGAAQVLGLEVGLQEGNIESLPFPDASFDGVSASGNVFTYDFETPCMLAEIHRVLRPGGVFALEQWPGDPNAPPARTPAGSSGPIRPSPITSVASTAAPISSRSGLIHPEARAPRVAWLRPPLRRATKYLRRPPRRDASRPP